MQEKIFDIIPPEEKNIKLSEAFYIKREIKKNRESNNNDFIPKKGKRVFIFLSFFIIFAFLAAFFWLNFFMAKAKILIYPQKDNFQFSEDIIFDSRVSQSDFEKKIIQSTIVEIDKNVSQEFKPTGTLKKKAEGVIRLYNAFSTNAETWVKGTRFVSSEGKLFLSKDKILVPGAKIENGKLVPSFVDVPVIAAEEGEEYNIGPSNFSVAAFLGTPKYTAFYGKSLDAMKGGGNVLIVQEKDLDSAKNILIDKAKKEGEADLVNKIESGFVLLPDSLIVDVLESTSSAQNGQQVESFTMSLKTKIRGLAYKEKDIIEFINKKLISNGFYNKSINFDKLNLEYKTKNLNIEEGFAIFAVESNVEIYQDIDLQSFVKNLAGKKIEEARIFLNNYSDITKYTIDIFPFWKKRLPSDIEKIEVGTVID
jgi:hypothetical protein